MKCIGTRWLFRKQKLMSRVVKRHEVLQGNSPKGQRDRRDRSLAVAHRSPCAQIRPMACLRSPVVPKSSIFMTALSMDTHFALRRKVVCPAEQNWDNSVDHTRE